MHKIFLAVASMIVTHFLQKAYRKITEQPTIDKEEIYRQMKKAEYEARRAAARPVIAKLDSISTPRDGEKWMASIGSVQELRDALRPCSDLGLRAWGGDCNGSAMGVAR